jgi:hypothetical protein
MTKSKKEIAQVLDRAAVRASAQNQRPATAKQCWFLACLMLKSSRHEADLAEMETDALSAGDASAAIDMYLQFQSLKKGA